MAVVKESFAETPPDKNVNNQQSPVRFYLVYFMAASFIMANRHLFHFIHPWPRIDAGPHLNIISSSLRVEINKLNSNWETLRQPTVDDNLFGLIMNWEDKLIPIKDRSTIKTFSELAETKTLSYLPATIETSKRTSHAVSPNQAAGVLTISPRSLVFVYLAAGCRSLCHGHQKQPFACDAARHLSRGWSFEMKSN